MKFIKLLALMLLVPALVYAENNIAPVPKQNIKAEIKVITDDKEVVLPAKRPELEARTSFIEDFWRLLFNSNQPIVPVGAFKFQTTIDPNDLPGGGFYLCSTRDVDDKFYFNISGMGSAPFKEWVVFKPSDITSVKNQDSSFTYTLPAPIKPGRYAIYFADSQYAWPFVVK